MDYEPDEARIALHEAGHAIVAHLLGGQVHEVSLENDDAEGRASILWQSQSAKSLARCHGMTALGGPLAELHQYGDEAMEELRVLEAWEADWSAAEQAAREFVEDPEKVEAQLGTWVRSLRDWFEQPEVEEGLARVSDQLLAHGTLDESLFLECLGL